jgi:hypothetical protein
MISIFGKIKWILSLVESLEKAEIRLCMLPKHIVIVSVDLKNLFKIVNIILVGKYPLKMTQPA